MKKNLIFAAVLGAFAMGAHAQSSVTLYGSLDAGIVYANNAGGQSLWQQGSGSLSYNYFGLRGAEDLGGGMKAIFTLESGFNLNNGSFRENNTMFDRQAYLGLKSDRYGTLTLGRQFDSTGDYLTPLSAAGMGYGNNLAAHPFDNDNLARTYSIKNAIKFTSADYAGVQFGGLYGFSNDVNGFANGRSWGMGAKYGTGPLNFAASYMQSNNSGSLGAAGSAASASRNIAASLQRTYGAGVSYAFGPAQVGFVWTRSQADGIASLASGGVSLPGMNGTNLSLDNYEINGKYSITPALALVGSYTFTDGSVSGNGSDNSPKWHSFVLGTDYSLSRRTDLYAAAVYQHATGNLGYTANGSAIQNVAAINMLSPSSTGNQVAATVGVRHRF